ncbi:MAG TPA: RodZ domain-containing protein [Gaiellales bacterium]|nr:RodZ domain-containing protein [Gaiellales bacterium]
MSQNGVHDGAGSKLPEQRELPVIDDAGLADEVVSRQTLGQILRQERELRDIPLDRIEQATRIRSAQLRAIEDDRLEALPAEAYARGFVRTYAEYLGLNGDDVVAIFNEQWNRSVYRAEPALPQAPVSVARSSSAGVFSLWVGLACLLLVGSAVLYLLGGSGGSHSTLPPPTTQAPATPPATSPTTSARQSPPPAQPAGVRMTVTAAQGSCWLEARRGSQNGALLTERTLAPGQAVHLHGRRVWLRLGDPSSVRLRVNGRTLGTTYPAQPINLLVTPHGATQL